MTGVSEESERRCEPKYAGEGQKKTPVEIAGAWYK